MRNYFMYENKRRNKFVIEYPKLFATDCHCVRVSHNTIIVGKKINKIVYTVPEFDLYLLDLHVVIIPFKNDAL